MVVAAGVSPQQMAEEMERQADKHLRQVTATLPHELSVTTILRHGNAAKEILKVSKEGNYHLLVMGSRRRGRFVSNVFGSVAADVHFATTLPMLVVHPEQDAV
jgi:nucleotide-binding universal stress UspA family protein